jgi:hypothetical protein
MNNGLVGVVRGWRGGPVRSLSSGRGGGGCSGGIALAAAEEQCSVWVEPAGLVSDPGPARAFRRWPDPNCRRCGSARAGSGCGG